MIHKIKTFGIAVVAILALSATLTSAASAQFTTTADATITAEETLAHTFKFTGQNVVCSVAPLHGTAPAASFKTINLQPTYTGCLYGGAEAKVTGFGKPGEANRCWYSFASDTSAALACNGGDVTIEFGSCVVHIPAQALGGGALTYTNGTASGKKDITVALSFTKITATHTDAFLCPFLANGHAEEGTLTGENTITATSGGGSVDLSVD